MDDAVKLHLQGFLHRILKQSTPYLSSPVLFHSTMQYVFFFVYNSLSLSLTEECVYTPLSFYKVGFNNCKMEVNIRCSKL